MIRICTTRYADDRGRNRSAGYCSAACDDCGAEHARIWDTSEFCQAMARAGAVTAGWVEHIDGRVLRLRCPACVRLELGGANAARLDLKRDAINYGQLPLPGVSP